MQRTTTGWSCLTVATSYEAFIAQASGRAWNPEQKATGSRPDPAALLPASQQLTGSDVSCVSVDMPPGHNSDRAAPALIECYPHIEHLAGLTVGLGDDTTAIWIPQSLVSG